MDKHGADETFAAPTAASAAAVAAAKPKRPERERKKKARFELLHSMTIEQRRQYLLDEDAEAIAKAARMRRAVESDRDVQRIAIDLSFDAIMNEKEIRSLAKQMKLSYGAIKQMEKPFQLHFLNCSAALKQSLELFSADKWLVHWHNSASDDGSVHHHVTEIAAPADLVYLSPDSPNVLTTLDATKTYVIGGIVDKSRKKGATLSAASSAGITTARLPIQEFITERLDHILNVNTVVEVLISFQETGGDWAKALRMALPQRKQSQVGRKARRRQAKLDDDDDDDEETHENLDSESKCEIATDSLAPHQAAQESNAESRDVETEAGSMIEKLQLFPVPKSAERPSHCCRATGSNCKHGGVPVFRGALWTVPRHGEAQGRPWSAHVHLPEHFQAFPAPHVGNKNGSFGLHHDPHYDPQAITPAVASAAQPPVLSLKEQAPSPWKYSPSVHGQFPQAYTADDIQRVRDDIASAQPLSRRKQRRNISPLRKEEQQQSDEVSLTKLRLALGPGSYEVDKDVNQEKISTNFPFGRERRKGLMDHVLARGENGCSPGIASCSCNTETTIESPQHAARLASRVRSESELQRQRQDVEKISKELAKSYKEFDASVQKLDRRLSSPNIRAASFQRFEKEPSVAESYRRGPGSCDHQSISIRVRSRAGGAAAGDHQNRNAHLVAKPRSNFGCVKHRDLVKLMVAADHVNRECLGSDELLEAAKPSSVSTSTTSTATKRETTPDYLSMTKALRSGSKKNTKDPSGDNSEAPAELSRQEMWNVLKNGPSTLVSSPNGKLGSRDRTLKSSCNRSSSSDRRRAKSPVCSVPPSPSGGTQEDQPAAPPES